MWQIWLLVIRHSSFVIREFVIPHSPLSVAALHLMMSVAACNARPGAGRRRAISADFRPPDARSKTDATGT